MPFARAFESAHGQPRTAAGYVIGQQFFTPRSISTVAAIPGDQPYAGYLYGGIYWQRQAPLSLDNNTHQVFDHFEINLGVVGNSSLAQDIQTVIHDQFNSQPPNGWDNQLKDELTYHLYYRRKWRFDTGSFDLPLLGDLETQIIPHAGFALGNVHRNADVGITARIGFNLPDDFGAGRINDLRAATGNTDTAAGHGSHGDASADATSNTTPSSTAPTPKTPAHPSTKTPSSAKHNSASPSPTTTAPTPSNSPGASPSSPTISTQAPPPTPSTAPSPTAPSPSP